MSKMRREEVDRMRELLVDAISTLCRSGMKYKSEMRVEGLLGVTLDEEDVILINVNKTYEMPQYGKKTPQVKQKVVPRKMPSPDDELQGGLIGEYKIKEASVMPSMKQVKPRGEPAVLKQGRYQRAEANPVPVMRQGPQRMEMYERQPVKQGQPFRGDPGMGMMVPPMRYNQPRAQYNMPLRHPLRTDANVGMKYPQQKMNVCPPMKIPQTTQMRGDMHAGITIKQERTDIPKHVSKGDMHAGTMGQSRMSSSRSSPLRQSQSTVTGAVVKPVQKSEATSSTSKSSKGRPPTPMKQETVERTSEPVFRVKTEPPDDHDSYSMEHLENQISPMMRIKTEPKDSQDEYETGPNPKRLKSEKQTESVGASSSHGPVMDSETTGALEHETWSEDSQHFQQYPDELAEADREIVSDSGQQKSGGFAHGQMMGVKLEVTSDDDMDEFDDEMYGYYDEHGEYHEYEQYEDGFYEEYGEEIDEGEMFDPNDPGMPPAGEHGDVGGEHPEMGEGYTQGEGSYQDPGASPDPGVPSSTPGTSGKLVIYNINNRLVSYVGDT